MTDARRLVVRCHDHPTYRGLEAPKRDCSSCWVVHRLRGATARLHGPNVGDLYTARVGSA